MTLYRMRAYRKTKFLYIFWRDVVFYGFCCSKNCGPGSLTSIGNGELVNHEEEIMTLAQYNLEKLKEQVREVADQMYNIELQLEELYEEDPMDQWDLLHFRLVALQEKHENLMDQIRSNPAYNGEVF